MISIPFPIFHHPYVPSRERRCVRTGIRGLVSVESPRFTRLCMLVYNNLLRVSFNISLWINLLLLLLLLLLHFFTLVRLPTFPNVRGRFMEVEEEVFFELLASYIFFWKFIKLTRLLYNCKHAVNESKRFERDIKSKLNLFESSCKMKMFPPFSQPS